jgi:hypothetical protein
MLFPLSSRARGLIIGLTAGALAVASGGAAHADPGVQPPLVAEAVAPGASFEVAKIVETPPYAPAPDVVLLVDTTGSMVDAIDNVRANLQQIIATVQDAQPDDQPDAHFAVASYRDTQDGDELFTVHQDLTADTTQLQQAVDGLTTGGGDDVAEDWINALYELSSGPEEINYRADSSRIVVLVGDAPSHDPSNGRTLDQAVTELQADDARVIGVDVLTELADGLDALGQASDVVTATGGQLLSQQPDQVSAAILAGLENLDATVTPQVGACDPALSVSFDPPEATVPSGELAEFTETITVAADAPVPGLLHCTVDFLVNGLPAGQAFVQTIAITVSDDEPPVVTVDDQTVEATGPAGTTIDYPATAVDDVDGPLVPSCDPPSGSLFPIGDTTVTCTATDQAGNEGSDTATMTVVDTTAPAPGCTPGGNPSGPVPPAGNPDGFYLLSATDLVDESAEVFIRDTGDPGVNFGPYPSGTRIKLVQAPGAVPQVKPGTGEIDYKVRLRGDALIVAVDGGGNTSPPVLCVVLPKP